MTFAAFCDAIRTLSLWCNFSVTSWFRSEKRNYEKGGVPLSWHLVGMAVDVVPDDRQERERIRIQAPRFGLEVVEYDTHLHLEPKG